MDPRVNEHVDQPNQRINQILELMAENLYIDLHQSYQNYTE